MKSAIVGMGVIGNVHFDVLKTVKEAQLVALCDVDLSKLDAFENVNKYDDYDKLLENESLDVIHICTPHYLHTDMIIKALDKNINVLCEKPLCIKEEDIPKIIEAEKRSKAKLGVCHQNRYNTVNVFVKDYLKDKKITGAHAHMVWKRTADYYNSAKWRGKWATEGGGVLINQALHTLDLLIWLLGEPNNIVTNISNNSLKDVIEVEDTASIVAKGSANFTFFATNASSFSFPVLLNISTENETILVYENRVVIGDREYDFEKDNVLYGKCCYGTGHKGLFNDFYSTLNDGKKFWLNSEECSKVIKVILQTYKQGNYLKK